MHNKHNVCCPTLRPHLCFFLLMNEQKLHFDSQQMMQLVMAMNGQICIGYWQLANKYLTKRNGILVCCWLVLYGFTWPRINEITGTIVGFSPGCQQWTLVSGRRLSLRWVLLLASISMVCNNLMILILCAIGVDLKKLGNLWSVKLPFSPQLAPGWHIFNCTHVSLVFCWFGDPFWRIKWTFCTK